MRRLLTFGLILVWAGSISAQTFNISSKYDLSTFYFRSLISIDTSIYAVGFGADTIEPTKPKLFIANYDEKGNLLKFVNPLDTLKDSFYSSDNSILEIDSALIFLTKYSNSSVFNNPCLFKANKNLKLKQIEKLEFPNYLSVNSFGLTKVSKTKFLLLTSAQYKSGDNIDVFLHLMDRDFSIVWSKMFGVQNKYDIPYSAVNLSSGNLLIGAHRTDAGMTVAGQRYKEQTWIFEIDTAGNMVREFLDTNTRTGPAKGLTQTNDGGFVYCGNYQTYWNGVFQYDHKPSLSKVDGNLTNKVWETIFNDTLGGDQSFESIKTNDGVNLIVCGNGFSEYPNSFGVLNTGTISKIDQKGNVLWLNHFSSLVDSSNLDHGFFYDVALTNNSIISCGKTEGLSGPTEGWLVKLNANGCFDNGNCGFNSLEVESRHFEKENLIVYPNPFSNEFNLDFQNLQFESIEIFNYLGNLIYSSKRVKAKVDMSGFPSGVYFIKLNKANGNPIIKKAIKK